MTRKRSCPSGHPYDAVNTYVKPSGYRQCRECSRQQQRQAYARKVA